MVTMNIMRALVALLIYQSIADLISSGCEQLRSYLFEDLHYPHLYPSSAGITPQVPVLGAAASSILTPGSGDLSDIVEHRFFRSQNTIVCRTLQCLDSFARSQNNCYVGNNTVIYAYTTSNLKDDMLIHLFMSWVYELLSSKRYNMVFLFLEMNPMIAAARVEMASLDRHQESMDKYIFYATLDEESLAKHIIKTLPPCTVFAVNNCDSWSAVINPHGLIHQRKIAGYHRNVLLHLNHEQPYSEVDDASHFFDHCYGRPYNILETYRKYDLVVRHFYYDIYNESNIQFIPLGAKNLRSVRQFRMEYGVSAASTRKHSCYFSGRFAYPRSGPHDKERQDILAMVQENSFPCDVLQSATDIAASPQLPFLNYLIVIANTVFAPCPAGNVPETFRLYEALELGAIPIVARQDAYMDFFLSAGWEDYPAPRLETFTHFRSFVNDFLYPLSLTHSIHDESQSCQVITPDDASLTACRRLVHGMPNAFDFDDDINREAYWYQLGIKLCCDLLPSDDHVCSTILPSAHLKSVPSQLYSPKTFQGNNQSCVSNTGSVKNLYHVYINLLQHRLIEWYQNFKATLGDLLVERILMALYPKN